MFPKFRKSKTTKIDQRKYQQFFLKSYRKSVATVSLTITLASNLHRTMFLSKPAGPVLSVSLYDDWWHIHKHIQIIKHTTFTQKGRADHSHASTYCVALLRLETFGRHFRITWQDCKPCKFHDVYILQLHLWFLFFVNFMLSIFHRSLPAMKSVMFYAMYYCCVGISFVQSSMNLTRIWKIKGAQKWSTLHHLVHIEQVSL